MRISEIKELTRGELETKLTDAKKSLFSLKFQKSRGQLENVKALRNVKKDIAKLETLMREKELAIHEKREVRKGKDR